MLEQFSDRVRECYEFAAEARAKADATNDSALKVELLNAERRWLGLAQSFGFTESLKDFTAANSERRRWADYFLRAKKASEPGASIPASAELWSIIDNSDDAIITKNLDGIISSWNRSAERIFGYTAPEVIGKSVTILIPPDRQNEEPAILARLRRGERVDHYETVRQRKDGSLVIISLTVSPVRDAEGNILGASKIARDITERKRSEEQIATLAREAEHRAKNLLATVQATVNLSRSETPDGLKRAIEGRIQALVNVHGLFVETRWKGANLSSLARQELVPYLHEKEARASV